MVEHVGSPAPVPNVTHPRGILKVYLTQPKVTYALSVANHNLWSRVNVSTHTMRRERGPPEKKTQGKV